MPKIAWIVLCMIALTAISNAGAANTHLWHIYTYCDGAFTSLQVTISAKGQIGQSTDSLLCSLAHFPLSWHVLAAHYTDLTHDGISECALLVWRPWQDWPIMKWSAMPSPIAANQDVRGDSAHIILVEPSAVDHQSSDIKDQPPAYRELWAGSALAVPITQIAVGDVDGDGWNELVALEGDYATGRYGPARHVAVWRWNGFGFTLEWRSPPDRLVILALSDLDGDGTVEILVR